MPSYRLANAVAGLLLVVVVGWYAYRFVMSFIPPSEYVSVAANPAIVHQGDSLFLSYMIWRKRRCPTWLHLFIVTDTDAPREVWSTVVLSGGVTPLGIAPASREIEAVKFLPPGDYIFRGASNPKCAEGDHFYFHEDVKFKIVPR